MKISIKTRPGYSRVEVTVESGNTKIVEEIAEYIGLDKWIVPESFIEDLISVSNEASKFNEVDDVDFCLKICESLLSDYEREELIQKLIKTEK